MHERGSDGVSTGLNRRRSTGSARGRTIAGSGNISNIHFENGTPQQQAQVEGDYGKLPAAEGPYMTAGQQSQEVDVGFDNTPAGLTTDASSQATKIELNSKMSGQELDAVAGHKFHNAYTNPNSTSTWNGKNGRGYAAGEYMGDALMRQVLACPKTTTEIPS